MTAVRSKLSNYLPKIDYYNPDGKWVGSMYEKYAGWWSVKLIGPAKQKIQMLSCYHTEEEAFKALCFWVDMPITYLRSE